VWNTPQLTSALSLKSRALPFHASPMFSGISRTERLGSPSRQPQRHQLVVEGSRSTIQPCTCPAMAS
jgi:hypothetical protein